VRIVEIADRDDIYRSLSAAHRVKDRFFCPRPPATSGGE